MTIRSPLLGGYLLGLGFQALKASKGLAFGG
jgi:hypothetical protein